MRAILVVLGIAALVMVILMSLGIVALDQTRMAQLPSISVEGGQTPEFKADVGTVDLATENRTVEVPVLEVERADDR